MECWHMSGAGNRFAVVDSRQAGDPAGYAGLARALCRRLGADGMMVLEPERLRLHFYNRDGSRGEMCGNGSRCACRFAYDRGLAGARLTLLADAGPVAGERLGQDRYRVALNLPTVLDPERKPGCTYLELGSPGLPHAVLELNADPEPEALRASARALRRDPAFPKGANVNFFHLTAPDRGRILTYERGVEDYTLACGTGAGAVAAALWAGGRLPGGRLTLDSRGGSLSLELASAGGRLTRLALEGPAEILEILTV